MLNLIKTVCYIWGTWTVSNTYNFFFNENKKNTITTIGQFYILNATFTLHNTNETVLKYTYQIRVKQCACCFIYRPWLGHLYYNLLISYSHPFKLFTVLSHNKLKRNTYERYIRNYIYFKHITPCIKKKISLGHVYPVFTLVYWVPFCTE